MKRSFFVRLSIMAMPGALAACGSTGSSAQPVTTAPDDRFDAGESGEIGPDHATPDQLADAVADAPDFDSCSAPGDCVIAANDCCGQYPVTPASYTAIRRSRVQAWQQKVCPSPSNSSCDATIIYNDKLLAFCVEGQCKEVYVPEDPISACSNDSDCTTVARDCLGVTSGSCLSPFKLRADQVATVAGQMCTGIETQSLQCPPADADAGLISAVCGTNGHCQ